MVGERGLRGCSPSDGIETGINCRHHAQSAPEPRRLRQFSVPPLNRAHSLIVQCGQQGMQMERALDLQYLALLV